MAKNRWIYPAKQDKFRFTAAMYIISLAAMIQLFLYDNLFFIIYRTVYNSIVFYNNSFLYSLQPEQIEEIHNIIVNVAMILTTVTISSITGAFIILCMKRFAPVSDYNNNKTENKNNNISFKRFKLPKNAPVLIAVGLCIFEFSVFAYNAFDYYILYGIFGVESYALSDAFFPQTVMGFIWYFIAVVTAPAIFEEFVFRYAMLNSLKKYGNAFAITVTSLLFGFTHARMSAFVYATAIGFFMGYIAVKTKSIWFPVLLHMAVNGTSLAFQYFSVRHIWEAAVLNIIYFAFLSFISAVSFIYLIYLIIKKKKTVLSVPANYIHISKRRKLLLFFNAASVIFFLYAVISGLEEYGLRI